MRNHRFKALCLSAVVAVLGLETRAAEIVTAEYVKTIGGHYTGNTPPTMLGGRLAVDEKGDAYCGTPGGASSVQKLTQDGRVVWQFFKNVPGFQATAVDEKYLYTAGSGYYGHRQVYRFDRQSGVGSEGWQLEWKKDEDVNDVRAVGMPVALAVNNDHLFIADSVKNELRRLDKKTGKEAPFNTRVMVINPVDIAVDSTGKILLLTSSTLLEIDKDGNPTRVPLVNGLSGAVAVDVSPLTGDIYIAEGGTLNEPVNRIRIFSKDGKDSGNKIGFGGEFSGLWSPEKFAFSGGSGDIAFAKNGELYVNPGWSSKLGALSVTSRFDKDGKFISFVSRIDQRGGMAADDELSIYLDGQFKVTWDNNVEWTSGMILSADPAYPSDNPTWPVYPTFAKGKVYFYCLPGGNIYELDRKSGKKIVASAIGQSKPICGNGKNLFALDGNALKIFDDKLKLGNAVFTFKPEANEKITGVEINDEQSLVFAVIAVEKEKKSRLACYDVAGNKLLWQKDCNAYQGFGVRYFNGLIIAGTATEGGKQILDAKSGDLLCLVDDKKVINGRAPLNPNAHAAFAMNKGVEYLFCDAPEGFRAYKINRQKTEGK